MKSNNKPKQKALDKFQLELNKIKLDQQIKSYASQRNIKQSNLNDNSSLSHAKINLLISNSNNTVNNHISDKINKEERSKTPSLFSPKGAINIMSKKINAPDISNTIKYKMIQIMENNINDLFISTERDKPLAKSKPKGYKMEVSNKQKKNYEANSFMNRKNEIMSLITSNDNEKDIRQLENLNKYEKKNQTMLHSGSYIRISLDNMKKTFKL